MKLKILLIAILVIVSCKNVNKTNALVADTDIDIEKQKADTLENKVDLEIYDYAGLEKIFNKKDGKIYVINFWATWCGPCVKELPYFEKLNDVYKDENVEVILVSLDFPHLYEKKLKPYIKEHHLKSRVIALNDDDMNTWIPKVNKDWSGAIPATVIYKNDTRKFFEKSFTYEELETEVKQF